MPHWLGLWYRGWVFFSSCCHGCASCWWVYSDQLAIQNLSCYPQQGNPRWKCDAVFTDQSSLWIQKNDRKCGDTRLKRPGTNGTKTLGDEKRGEEWMDGRYQARRKSRHQSEKEPSDIKQTKEVTERGQEVSNWGENKAETGRTNGIKRRVRTAGGVMEEHRWTMPARTQKVQKAGLSNPVYVDGLCVVTRWTEHSANHKCERWTCGPQPPPPAPLSPAPLGFVLFFFFFPARLMVAAVKMQWCSQPQDTTPFSPPHPLPQPPQPCPVSLEKKKRRKKLQLKNKSSLFLFHLLSFFCFL